MTMEVDDVLIKGDDKDEFIERFKKFLHRYQKLNIKLARRKLQYGLVGNFAWMLLGGERGHKPALAKLEAIATLKAPKNISDLQSFLRMLNSFRNFMLDMTQMVPNIR